MHEFDHQSLLFKCGSPMQPNLIRRKNIRVTTGERFVANHAMALCREWCYPANPALIIWLKAAGRAAGLLAGTQPRAKRPRLSRWFGALA